MAAAFPADLSDPGPCRASRGKFIGALHSMSIIRPFGCLWRFPTLILHPLRERSIRDRPTSSGLYLSRDGDQRLRTIGDTSPSTAGILDATWTAPTTNTDGSPLTDLASYLLYYGISTSPCPGASSVQVAS